MNLLATFGPAFTTVVVMVVWKVVGFTMILLLTGLQAIPADLTEAARIDGAGRRQRFRFLTLPIMRRTLALALILSITGSVLALDQFYIRTSGGPQSRMISVAYYIFNQSFVSFHLGYGAALSIALLLALVALSAVQLWLLKSGTSDERASADAAAAPGGPWASTASGSWRPSSSWPRSCGRASPPSAGAQAPPLPPWPTAGVSLDAYRAASGADRCRIATCRQRASGGPGGLGGLGGLGAGASSATGAAGTTGAPGGPVASAPARIACQSAVVSGSGATPSSARSRSAPARRAASAAPRRPWRASAAMSARSAASS